MTNENLNIQDQQQITETVQGYFSGSYEADADKLRQVFHKDAHISGNFKGQYLDWTLDQFIERVVAAESHKHEPFLKEILNIEITNDIAFAKAKVMAAGIIFIDYISLIKINGIWWIRHKSFTTI